MIHPAVRDLFLDLGRHAAFQDAVRRVLSGGNAALAGLTTGLGIQAWGHEFSYAWVPLGDLGNTHYFSFVFRFGRTEAKRNLISYRTLRPRAGSNGAEVVPSEDQQLQQILDADDGFGAAKR